ncbi:ABC transporter permease [Cumulibacter soli]|uniref:ABC transporter permease n=1 Tax=Cumulibacter soli TaxID=2546344 RepID=UPI001ABBA558|nr:ABC transporter permease [Cumulibacter soli]
MTDRLEKVSAGVETVPPLEGMSERSSGRNRWPIFSGGVLAIFVFTGIAGPLLAPHPPDEVNLAASLRPPVFSGGSWSYPLGTDQLGRDVLSRLLSGAQVSFLVALAVVLLAGVIGVMVALVAGYFGGRLDGVLMRIADASMAFPLLLLAVIIVGIFGPSLLNVIIVLVLAGWPQYARVLRSEVLRLRTQDFVTMARVMGAQGRWTITRHIFPNIVGSLLVLATLQVGVAVIAEGSLSFLGIGVPPPASSWGNMLSDGKNFLTVAWWLPVLPGVCLSLTVLAANLFGDWLRTHLDPTRRR